LAFDLEIDADALISLSDFLVELQESVQINVAFERRFNFLDFKYRAPLRDKPWT